MMGNIFRYNRELLKQLGEVHFNVFFLKKSEFKCLIQISSQFFIYLSILDQFVVKIKRILYNFELILNKFWGLQAYLNVDQSQAFSKHFFELFLFHFLAKIFHLKAQFRAFFKPSLCPKLFFCQARLISFPNQFQISFRGPKLSKPVQEKFKDLDCRPRASTMWLELDFTRQDELWKLHGTAWPFCKSLTLSIKQLTGW